jgi:hypothetical protein
MIGQLILEEVMEQIQRYELGEIWSPLDPVLKKCITIS